MLFVWRGAAFDARLGDVVERISTIAGQTAKATGEIGEPISGIQSATRESVGAIAEISGSIGRLSGNLLAHRGGGALRSPVAVARPQPAQARRRQSLNSLRAA